MVGYKAIKMHTQGEFGRFLISSCRMLDWIKALCAERNIWTEWEREREKVTGGWRKLHNEELRTVYSPPYTISAIKSRTMRWAEIMSRKGYEKFIQNFNRKT